MAKKHFGKLLTLAAIVGAAAAGVSYVLQYKSFHKELDEDFHDFEDDFDDFDDAGDKEASKKPSAQMLRFPRTAKLLPRKRIPTQPRMTAQP